MPLASNCDWAGRFVSYLVTKPEDRFSRDMAQLIQPLLMPLGEKKKLMIQNIFIFFYLPLIAKFQSLVFCGLVTRNISPSFFFYYCFLKVTYQRFCWMQIFLLIKQFFYWLVIA